MSTKQCWEEFLYFGQFPYFWSLFANQRGWFSSLPCVLLISGNLRHKQPLLQDQMLLSFKHLGGGILHSCAETSFAKGLIKQAFRRKALRDACQPSKTHKRDFEAHFLPRCASEDNWSLSKLLRHLRPCLHLQCAMQTATFSEWYLHCITTGTTVAQIIHCHVDNVLL